MSSVPDAFAPEDFADLSALVLDAWRSAITRDWSAPAGTLEWSCWTTADHTVDCVFSYASFLASRRHTLPPFKLHHSPSLHPSTPRRPCGAVIAVADPDVEAVIGLVALCPERTARRLRRSRSTRADLARARRMRRSRRRVRSSTRTVSTSARHRTRLARSSTTPADARPAVRSARTVRTAEEQRTGAHRTAAMRSPRRRDRATCADDCCSERSRPRHGLVCGVV